LYKYTPDRKEKKSKLHC